MAIASLFEAKIDELRALLGLPALRVLVITHEPDLRNVLLRILVGLEADDDLPHVLGYCGAPFSDYLQYFGALVDSVAGEFEAEEAAFREEGVELPPRPTWGKDPGGATPDLVARRVADYFSALAEAFPEEMGALVLILDPSAEVEHDQGFAWTVHALGALIRSDWFKLVVPDRRRDGRFPPWDEDAPWGTHLDFHVSPESIEAQVALDLAGGRLPPAEQRQYTAMAGAFALANGRPEEALAYHTRAAGMARDADAPADLASACYNLGNSLLELGRPAEAQDAYVEGVAQAIEAELVPLMAMLLTNLGIALHREGRAEEALRSFTTARETFRSLGHLPGEAHVLDCEGAAHHAAGDSARAEAAWLEGLGLYEGVTAGHLVDVRDAGVHDFTAKLDALYAATGEDGKRAALAARGAGD